MSQVISNKLLRITVHNIFYSNVFRNPKNIRWCGGSQYGTDSFFPLVGHV